MDDVTNSALKFSANHIAELNYTSCTLLPLFRPIQINNLGI